MQAKYADGGGIEFHGNATMQKLIWCGGVRLGQSVCSLVGFSQGLSAMIQGFFLTINQHQSSLSAQKLISEQAE